MSCGCYVGVADVGPEGGLISVTVVDRNKVDTFQWIQSCSMPGG